MSVETLREAARLMRERGKAATPLEGSTLWRYGHGGGRLANDSDGSNRQLIADFYGEGNREHYAAMTPAVALAVADWLDACALVQEVAPTRTKANALAVARAYLGESS